MISNKIIISILMSLLLIFSTSGFASAGADISVAFNTNNANVGDNVNIIVTITNTGPGDLSNVVVSAPIPAGLKFLNTSTGTVQNIYNSTTGVWDVGNLKLSSQQGGKKTLNITTQVMSEAAGKTITANASYLNVTDSSSAAGLKSAQSQALTIGAGGNTNASNTGNASSTNNTPVTIYILAALVIVIILAVAGYLIMRR